MLSTVNFSAPVTTTLNTGQFFIASIASATGDLNGDGVTDLIVGRGDGTAQVFLGAATGTFKAATIVGPGTQVMALADFNGDGNLDLATSQGVLLGKGDGTFAAIKAETGVPQNALALYAADVDGDGKMDLVAATFTPLTGLGQTSTFGLTVLPGKGDGTFGAAISTTIVSMSTAIRSFAVLGFGDFNNDGKLDVLSPFGVLPGNGDSTFKPVVALPLTAPGSAGSPPAPALPASPILALGDFNGDGNLDVATVPATSSTTGQIEILLGKGNGAFTDSGPVSVGTGTVVTALTTGDMNGDGQLDLIAGISSAAGTSNLAVLQNSGSGKFAAPTLFPVTGTPVDVSVADFNADGNSDILSLNAPAGSSPGTTTLPITTASVVLSIATAATVPVVGVKASKARVVAGTSVQFTAGVFAPPFVPGTPVPKATPPVPTGTVTFLNGTVPLGTGSLVNGRATLTTVATGLGKQAITVSYSGDANYAAATSAALSEFVLLSAGATPLLVPSLASVNLPALFVPGDAATVSVSLINAGGSAASGRIAINVYLSADGIIDASAIPVDVPSFRNRAVLIGSGQTVTLTGHFVLGTVPPGSYTLVAQIVPLSGLTSDELTQDTLTSSSTFTAAGLVFGNVGVHHALALKLTDTAGNRATLSLTGPGIGTVTQTNGMTEVTVTGTTSASRVLIVGKGSPFDFDTITIAGPLAGINMSNAALIGGLAVAGSVTNVTLPSIGTGGGATVPITLGAGAPVTLALGNVQGVTLTSAAPLRSLSANAWQGGAIVAPSIGTLTIKGALNADVQVSGGGKIQSSYVGTLSGGTWAISGGIGILHVNGDLTSTRIFAGADAGPDKILGTTDDVYTAAAIASVFVGGADTSTLIVAGAVPPAGGTLDSGLILLPKAAIRSVTVRGAISDDSRFLAASLPVRATLHGTTVTTATDPHFQQ